MGNKDRYTQLSYQIILSTERHFINLKKKQQPKNTDRIYNPQALPEKKERNYLML